MAASGRIRVRGPFEEWLQAMAGHPLIDVLPITAEIAADAARIGQNAPTDPADRIIIATARCHNLTLLTSDQRIVDWAKGRALAIL